MKQLLIISALSLFAWHSSVAGATLRRIQVKVVDETGKPVSGATVDARYLETTSQGGKDYHLPMDLAKSKETDSNGLCELHLNDINWSLAGLRAFRPELKTEEAEKLLGDAPKDKQEVEAYERRVNESMRRFSIGKMLLDPQTVDNTQVTLQLSSSERITGRVLLDGKPLSGAYVLIHSRSTPIDELFARNSPEITDNEGRIDYYSEPGDFDRARIVIELQKEKRVLPVASIPWTLTAGKREFVLDTNTKDYRVISKAPTDGTIKLQGDPFADGPVRDPFATSNPK